MIRVKRAVVAHDLHYPDYSKPTFETMLEVIKEIKPDVFIFGGDQFQNDEISHHNAKKPLYKPRRAYLNNQEKFDELVLKPIERALANACERVWVVGNHDFWEHEFIESHPEFEGLVDRPSGLSLAQRGWQVVPLGHAYQLGNLNVIHGEILTGIGNQAGIFPSKKAMELYGSNVLAGHTHSPQSFTKVSPVERKKKYMAYIAPILGSVNPDYLKNRPTSWLNGFTIVEVYNGKNFNCYPVICIEGECSYGGRHYGGAS
jgi:predicted phosphodiesterase